MLNKRMNSALINIFLLITLVSFLFTACPNPQNTIENAAAVNSTEPKSPATPGEPIDNSNLMFGNPSGAVTDVKSPNNYLMKKPQYALSYNNSKLTANWTSWHLFASDIGAFVRKDDFRADTTLPAAWYKVTEKDYQAALFDFDRGHLCPSADRTTTAEDNSATFLMTNMMPQCDKNNQITWNALETYERQLVETDGNEVYILCGPYGKGGTSTLGKYDYIPIVGRTEKITVPNQTWKIIVVLPNGTNDLNRVTSTTRVIAVIMPNDQTCNSKPWSAYRVSVDYIETLTGYDFLSNVSDGVEKILEAQIDKLII